jgi:predicted amidohydrolase YtcJ
MMMALVSGCGGGQQPAHADLILISGHILTQSDTTYPSPPTAVAMAGGKILAVGSDDSMADFEGTGTTVVNLKGDTVIPGLVDSHCHLYGLGKSLAQIDLMGTGSPQEILEVVRTGAEKFAADAWIEGRGWDQNDWAVQEYPDRAMLDGVIPDRPVFLRRVDGHAAWANSEALRQADITAETPDPEGGEIARDEKGEPTGILVDNAVDLVVEVIPEVGPEETRRRIELAVEHCVAHGLTGVHEAGVSWERAEVYRSLAKAGELDLRVYAMYDDIPATLEKAYAEGPVFTEDDMLTIRAIKLYADGALGSRGALLLEEYTDRPGHMGLPVTSTEHMRDVMTRGGRAGFQICTHAIGDGANPKTSRVSENWESSRPCSRYTAPATWTGPTNGWAMIGWPAVTPGARSSIRAPISATEPTSRWKKWTPLPDSIRPSPAPTPTALPSAAGSPRKRWTRRPPSSCTPPEVPTPRSRNRDLAGSRRPAWPI